MIVRPDTSSPDEHDGRVIGGRYQVQRELCSDRDKKTFLASDLSTGTTVVIKSLVASSLPASARMRLDHEADVLSRTGKGVMAHILDHGCEDDEFYLVRPFIPGITLKKRCSRDVYR